MRAIPRPLWLGGTVVLGLFTGYLIGNAGMGQLREDLAEEFRTDNG